MSGTTLLWLRDDLRLEDHPALDAALRAGDPVVPVYIHAPEEEAPWQPGAASRWWLHHSLAALDGSLRALGSRLVIRRGPTRQALEELVRETGAVRLHWTRRYQPTTRARDEALKRELAELVPEVRSYPGDLLFEPTRVKSGSGNPYRVFTPFYRACLALPVPPDPLPAPTSLPPVDPALVSIPLEDLELLPEFDWAGGLRSAWTPGEVAARRDLGEFLERAALDYATDRDVPGIEGTSRLSPRLRFGELSPRSVWHAVLDWVAEDHPRREAAGECFLRQIAWREFARHLLFHFPETTHAPLNPRFQVLPWRDDDAGLRAWRRGRTGFPIVDAGLRQLWTTGWMHNRVRMIAGSFLVKDLLVSWQEGARWFWDTLVDADLANNTLGWQWIGGCGADAAPFFRVFNPTLQGKRFDPDGSYVRSWLPELRELPDRLVHEPWKAPGGPPGGYPAPLVDHREARKRALLAYDSVKAASGGENTERRPR